MAERIELPPECEEYLREYARLALDPANIPADERQRVLDQVRASFDQVCSTPEGRAALAESCVQMIASLRAIRA